MDRCLRCNAEVLIVPSATSGTSMTLDAKPTSGVRVFQRYGIEVVDYSGDTHTMTEPEMVAEVVYVYTGHDTTCHAATSRAARD